MSKMRLFRAIDIAASGLTAERLRMDIISNNIANVNTTRTVQGTPYRRQVPVYAAREQLLFATYLQTRSNGNPAARGNGVKVIGIREDQSPGKLVYDPNHPDANAEGYVEMPNVNIVNEMVDMISATRAYEANVTVINNAKSMAMQALEIGRG